MSKVRTVRLDDGLNDKLEAWCAANGSSAGDALKAAVVALLNAADERQKAHDAGFFEGFAKGLEKAKKDAAEQAAEAQKAVLSVEAPAEDGGMATIVAV